MSEVPLAVYLDTNDADWTSQRQYVDSLLAEYETDPRVEVVRQPQRADVVHLNFLNPFGRLVHGKEKWRTHVRDIGAAVLHSDAPVVVTEHGVEEFSPVERTMYIEHSSLSAAADALKRVTELLVARAVDAIVAISSMDRRYLVQAGIDEAKVHHVPHGVGDEFLTAPDRPRDGFVLHVSKRSPHKNPAAILETARRLDTRMVLVGGGWAEHHGAELDDIDTLDVRGHVPRDELVELYSTARACYFPSTYEPFGLPILESMACGTPVVASRYSAAPDLCDRGIDIVDPHDIDRHVACLRRLVEDDELFEARSGLVRSRAQELTWAATADQTIRIYEGVVT